MKLSRVSAAATSDVLTYSLIMVSGIISGKRRAVNTLGSESTQNNYEVTGKCTDLSVF